MHYKTNGGVLNSQYFGSSWNTYVNYVIYAMQNNVVPAWNHLSLPDAPSTVTAATQAAARTNPSRPYVDVITNVLQLGEIALLLKDFTGSFVSRIGHTNLMYQFGIAPVVGDIVKLFNFQEQVERRVLELRRLISDKGLRRTISIGVYSASLRNPSETLQSAGELISRETFRNTVQEVKAHCRWIPSTAADHLGDTKAMRALARKAVLGLTVDFSTAWEIIPWSWLVDWCSSIGSYLAAHRNIVPATLDTVSIMRHTRTTLTSPSYSGPGARFLNLTALDYLYETKQRELSVVLPTAHFPFLSGKQMGILASLWVTGQFRMPR